MGRAFLLAWVVVLVVATSSASADPIDLMDGTDCLEAVPSVVAPPSDEPVDLYVQVLLDRVTKPQGEKELAKVGVPYEELGIKVHLAFDEATLQGTDTLSLIAQAKQHYGNKRPVTAHLVYVLTSVDLTNSSGNAVAGQTDCIGGIALPERAFAVGEVDQFGPSDFGGVTLFANTTSKVAAHEIGHLLGAQHHYSNCVEGTTASDTSDYAPCTLMINDVGLASLHFSPVDALVVRGHAEEYATRLSPPPAAPSEKPAPSQDPEPDSQQQPQPAPAPASSEPAPAAAAAPASTVAPSRPAKRTRPHPRRRAHRAHRRVGHRAHRRRATRKHTARRRH